MGWSLRKSLRLLPGIRINLSKSGPRLSVGIPSARASINMQGKARIFGGKGPIRYQRTLTIDSPVALGRRSGTLMAFIQRLIEKS
jgi:hypothetical protein